MHIVSGILEHALEFMFSTCFWYITRKSYQPRIVVEDLGVNKVCSFKGRQWKNRNLVSAAFGVFVPQWLFPLFLIYSCLNLVMSLSTVPGYLDTEK